MHAYFRMLSSFCLELHMYRETERGGERGREGERGGEREGERGSKIIYRLIVRFSFCPFLTKFSFLSHNF